MRVIVEGHRYELMCLDSDGIHSLQFVDRSHGKDEGGTTTQEVLRALINRVLFLDKEVPWDLNKEILKCLRRALILHEVRHLERVEEKTGFGLELLGVNTKNGHLSFEGGV